MVASFIQGRDGEFVLSRSPCIVFFVIPTSGHITSVYLFVFPKIGLNRRKYLIQDDSLFIHLFIVNNTRKQDLVVANIYG